MPKVSIVIPTHNRSPILTETLESVSRQTFSDFECVIVDDHSSDENTRLIAKKYSLTDQRFRAYELPPGRIGANAARNYGLEISRGEFINFLDSDDLLLPSKLQIQLSEFACNPTLDMVTCQHVAIREDKNGEFRYFYFALQESWLDVVWSPPQDDEKYGGLWCTNSPLWRRTAIQSIGGWDERLRILQDLELNVRAILMGLQIKRIEKILVHVRATKGDRISSSTPEKSFYQQKSVLVAWNLLKEKGEVTELRRKMIALRFLSISIQYFIKGKFVLGLYCWISGSLATEQRTIYALQGLLLLISMRFRHMKPITKLLQSAFRGHVKDLPDGLPCDVSF